MKTPKYVINGKPFKSQAEIKTHFQKILKESELDVSLSGEELDDCLHLFSRHPEFDEKRGCGIKHVQVTINPVYGDRCFWLIRSDGSAIDISYLTCVKAKKKSQREQMMAACRHAVVDQILDYKRWKFGDKFLINCDMTGRLVSKDDADIDHVIPFVQLVERFIQRFRIDVESILFVENEFGVSVDFGDEHLKKSWQLFHQQNAVLQVAHRKENQSKGCRLQNESP